MNVEFLNEKQYIMDSFKMNFEKYKSKKIVIYGVGPNTKLILENFPNYNIIGLMDEVSVGETKFGKKTISTSDAVQAGVELIVIVARMNNVPIIYRRISDICKLNNIPVYDINGNELVEVHEKENRECQYEKISKEVLIEKINNVDVISFDVFDTLIMRKVLYPRDIFRVLSKDSDGFYAKRVRAEEEFYSEGKNPNIYDIYNKLPEFDFKKEIELEYDYLIKRKAVCEILDYAKEQEKDVFAVSDMYLPHEIIYKIFEKLDIKIPKENIIVSCDYNVSKSNGLFLELRKKAGNKKILHIGDNFQADIISAKKYEIEDTFEIKSAVRMLEDSLASEILNYDKSIDNRMLIAELIAIQLNNPFIFSETKGKFKIENAYSLSYSFIAPFVGRFFQWMIKQAQELSLDGVLLAGRDGYIIEKIYLQLKDKYPRIPECKYFYTSRQAAILSGIETEEDIKFVASLAFSGTAKEMLKKRFMIDEKLILPQVCDDEKYILLHKEAIYEKCMQFRARYEQYIKTLGFKNGDKLGFVDFVSSGTSQKMLNNLFEKELIGLYVAIVMANTGYKPNIDVVAMLGKINVFNYGYKITSNYLYLENIMTSPEPSFIGIGDKGQKIYMEEKRSSDNLEELKIMHSAILDYVGKSKLKMDMLSRVDIEVVDMIVDFINDKYSLKYFDSEKSILEDEFCNRTFKL